MFNLFEKAIMGMALLRLLSGTIEIAAALLILKFNQIEKALIINSSLAIIGPIILIVSTSIGVLAIAGNISHTKLICITIGILFIIYGVKSN
ncbi:DUF2619 domain-containing protein [Aquibacillus halophilus]|uniref:DUF2619 domain-containing protein n=1 Tax=Aquibacillus halophilus TaxID=930132 RepID=A0A6A8DFI2_9BACI|nr:YqhV family protein [Aquibacillus halophilus]MRH42531.1 DUF2619 domain-containing protein [Aquibacillus halophilus]